MGTYEQLKQALKNVINTNGNQEITGQILQNAVLSIVSSIGENATFAGLAIPSTNPGSVDANVFYLACTPGVYANFGGYKVSNKIVIFVNRSGSWAVEDTGLALVSNVTQNTGSDTTAVMSQDAVTKALAGLLPNQRADNTPYISIAINDGDSGQNWETFNRKLGELASMPDPMPYNGDIRYFISEGLRVDVTNRIFDSSEGASRRLTQVVTGNIRLDDRLDLALNGDADQSFWRIYKEGAWSEWKSVNAGGGSGNVDVVQEIGSSTTAVMSQNAVTNEFKKRDNFYYTTLDVVSIDDGSSVSDAEANELANIQMALASQKTIISPAGVFAAFVTYRNSLYIARISYMIGQELYVLSTTTSKGGGGTWSVKIQDLSNLANNGYNVLIHGEHAHGEGVSSKLAYEGSTIPTDVQQIMTEWYMSSTGYAIAYGSGSHVEGQDCLATGDYAHAEGIKTLAANNGAHAEGTGTNAAGTYAHAEGQSTTAYATACHAEGGMCVCNGNYGHVEGFRCTVENTAGHAEGYITYCRANYGHVEGRQTNSIGPCAHAEGYGNKIDRSITITSISNVEGHTSYFKADNTSDLKVGACFIIDYIPYVVTNIADGNIYVNRWIEFKQQKYDIIIMYGAAYGNNAHTEGELGSAIGNNSHVSGVSCIAFNDNEVACGHYNFSFWSNDNAKRTLYSIGIGESDSNRKNAYELKENGDLYIYGVGGYTGKNSSEAKTIQKVITEQQQGSGLNDAPSDGNTYGRKDGEWTTTEEVIDLGVLDFDPNDTSTFSVFNPYLNKVGVYKFRRRGYFSQCRLDVFISGYMYGTPIRSAILTINEAGDSGSGDYYPEYWKQSIFIYTDGVWQRKGYVNSELVIPNLIGSTFPQGITSFDNLIQNGLYKISDTSGNLSGTINVTEHRGSGELRATTQSLHAYINTDDTPPYVLDGFRTFKDRVWSEWKTAKTTLE